MSISIYDASVSVFDGRLAALAAVLKTAEGNATQRKIDPAVLLAARLAPDMLPLRAQVQIATDHAKGASFRLAGREVPRFEDNETTFSDLDARIAKTREAIAGIAATELEGGGARRIELKLGGNDFTWSGKDYLLSFALPNFHFHVTTAYAILRHNGVPLGKRDFLGRV